MPIATVQDSQLFYEIRGTRGDPLVLIHGSWVDHHTWDPVVPGFAEAMQVVAYDRRGHGESTGPRREHPVRDDATDLAGLLEAINHYPAHLVAHSFGAAPALRLAIDRPEMVRSLSFHEPTFVGLLTDDPSTAPEAERLLAGVRALQKLVRSGAVEPAAAMFVDQFSTEPGAWDRLPPAVRSTFVRNAERWAEEFDDREAISPDVVGTRELLIPTLLTTGAQSPPFLRRISHALANLLHNPHELTIPDVGHVPQLSRPHQYIGIVGTFLLERNVPST